jgi:2-polyprenyl-3-methyl-5-hydroxy-6-metoxy-1,4-benzoquinol methylase
MVSQVSVTAAREVAMARVSDVAAPRYALGRAVPELERLARQADYFGDLTAHVLRLAGLSEGMRVLDIGSGAGDVSLLAGQIVGAGGSVRGVDLSADAVERARERAGAAGLSHVTFDVADVTTLEVDEPVDALIGRLVLMYLPDPAVVLRRLAAAVRPGGVVVFHEFDLAGATSAPRCELFEATLELVREGLTRAGAGVRTGLHLGAIFEEAGLGTPTMYQAARVERGAGAGIYEQITAIARTLLPVLQQTRVVQPETLDIDTLAARLCAESLALGATLVAPPFVGAWTRIALHAGMELHA